LFFPLLKTEKSDFYIHCCPALSGRKLAVANPLLFVWTQIGSRKHWKKNILLFSADFQVNHHILCQEMEGLISFGKPEILLFKLISTSLQHMRFSLSFLNLFSLLLVIEQIK